MTFYSVRASANLEKDPIRAWRHSMRAAATGNRSEYTWLEGRPWRLESQTVPSVEGPESGAAPSSAPGADEPQEDIMGASSGDSQQIPLTSKRPANGRLQFRLVNVRGGPPICEPHHDLGSGLYRKPEWRFEPVEGVHRSHGDRQVDKTLRFKIRGDSRIRPIGRVSLAHAGNSFGPGPGRPGIGPETDDGLPPRQGPVRPSL